MIQQFREIPLGQRQVSCHSHPVSVPTSATSDLVLPTLTLPYDMLFRQENDYCSGTLVNYKLVIRVNQGSNREKDKPKVAPPVQTIGQQSGINYDELEWDSSSTSSASDLFDEKSFSTCAQPLIAELPMFDSSQKSLMPSGRYEVALRPDNPNSPFKQESSQRLTWESQSSTTADLVSVSYRTALQLIKSSACFEHMHVCQWL